MLRSQGLGVLFSGLVVACVLTATPATAVVAAPTPPVGSCVTEDSAGISAALAPALFVAAPGTGSTEIACTAALVQPLSRWASITSNFGMRVHPISGATSMHYGTDFSRWGISGTDIRSIASGTVTGRIESFATTGTGNSVTIAHDGGVRSQYMHMLQPTTLVVGERVAAGQVIGYVGTTGGSTGAHLHLEVRLNGTHIDPAPYLAGAPYIR